MDWKGYMVIVLATIICTNLKLNFKFVQYTYGSKRSPAQTTTAY